MATVDQRNANLFDYISRDAISSNTVSFRSHNFAATCINLNEQFTEEIT